MKIRHPVLIKTVGLTGSWAIRLWMGTLRYRYEPLGPDLDPRQRDFAGRYIYAFWHENMLLPAYPSTFHPTLPRTSWNAVASTSSTSCTESQSWQRSRQTRRETRQ